MTTWMTRTLSGASVQYVFRPEESTAPSISTQRHLLSDSSLAYSFNGVSYNLACPRRKPNKGAIPGLFILTKDGSRCGRIFLRRSIGTIAHQFIYYSMELGDDRYDMYVVGFGSEGLKCPIYKGSTQVALIEKDLEASPGMDCYEITTVTAQDTLPATLLGLYLDMYVYANLGDVIHAPNKRVYYTTTNKSLKAMYSPDFKQIFAGGNPGLNERSYAYENY